jgi:hypothetical protein
LKPVHCAGCGKLLIADEIALNQRLLGMQIYTFHCLDCLAIKLDTTPSHLNTLITRFKEMGCAYFTRLMEDSVYEETIFGL